MTRTFVLLAFLGFACSSPNADESGFTINENEQGIELLENGRPVFFYQRKPKSSMDTVMFNNYLHPLYDLKGDTLTEEFPEDHPHHRGIFWAWHQLYIDGKSIGDSWMMQNVSMEVLGVNTTLGKGEAQLMTNVVWKTRALQNEKPFLEEHTSITVHQQQAGLRKIDFEISLKALVPGVEIGGSDDIKGYGGFCTRIKLPLNLVFTAESGRVTPIEGQLIAGTWMDFSTYDSLQQAGGGLSILCHPSTPNYPAPWILRQTGSMQNIVFPGAERIEVPMNEPTILRYRLIVHNGSSGKIDVTSLQSEYEQGMR